MARPDRVEVVEWLDDVYMEVARLSRSGRSFTSEDVWGAVGKRPGMDPRAMGGAFRRMHTRKLIVPTGEVRQASSKTRNKGLLRVWRGTSHL